MVDVVVLLGPPGSGKSAVGEALGARGFRWRDWEDQLVRRWGSRAAFLRDKAQAVAALHRSILEWLAASDVRAVLETTGLSDAPLVAEVRRTHRATIVRLDVAEETAIGRIRSRPSGRHLSDAPDDNRRVWDAYKTQVLPHHPVDLVVDTEGADVETIASVVVELMDARP